MLAFLRVSAQEQNSFNSTYEFYAYEGQSKTSILDTASFKLIVINKKLIVVNKKLIVYLYILTLGLNLLSLLN